MKKTVIEFARHMKATREVHVALAATPSFFVYSQPKSGTTTIEFALKKAGVCAPKIHFLHQTHEANCRRHRELGIPNPYHHFLEARVAPIILQRSLKVICLVREPVGRKISTLFQSPWLFGVDLSDRNAVSDFLNSRLASMGGDSLSWFRHEFERSFGTILQSQGFEPRDGYGIYRVGRCEILVLRTDRIDSLHSEIQNFVGKPLELSRENVGSKKATSHQYRDITERLRIPIGVLDAVYSDPLMSLFFKDAEVLSLRRRWSEGTA